MSQQLLVEPVFDFADKEQQAFAILDRAVDEYGPEAVCIAISGGNDSVVAGRIVSKHPATSHALLIDTQTGVQEGQDWTRALVAGWGLDLMVRRSPVSFEDLAARYGMLGRGHHRVYFNALKGRVFEAVATELAPKPAQRMVYVSGARRQESANRKRNVIPVRHDQHQQRIVWAAPILDWSVLECRAYLCHEGIEPNPVAQLLHRSGECNCPAYGTPEELKELRFWFPDAAAKLDSAMAVARANGKWDRWGEPVPAWFGMSEIGGLDDYLAPTCEPEACRDCPSRSNVADGGQG